MRELSQPAAVFIWLSLIGLVITPACGRAETQGAGDTASGARVSPSPTALSTAIPTWSPPRPVDTTNWQSYTSPKWGYSLKYPQTWHELPNYGGGDTGKYFSNENAGSPISMSEAGIYVQISVNGKSGDACLLRGLRNLTIEQQGNLAIDGAAATLNIGSSEGYGEFILNLQRSGYCYWFAYIFRSTAVRDATGPIAYTMLSQTFTFGQPVASPEP